MDEFKLGVGAAHEFEITANKAGWTNADFAGLTQNLRLCQAVRAVIRGEAKVEPVQSVVDLDAEPHLPHGLTLVEHKKGGLWKFDLDEIKLYASWRQKNGKLVDDTELYEQVGRQVVLNANVLDYLLAHQYLIPEEWKRVRVHFWGTVYTDGTARCVRFLCWNGALWKFDMKWTGGYWGSRQPAAILMRAQTKFDKRTG